MAARQRLLSEHDLFRKPVSTFRDHALARPGCSVTGSGGRLRTCNVLRRAVNSRVGLPFPLRPNRNGGEAGSQTRDGDLARITCSPLPSPWCLNWWTGSESNRPQLACKASSPPWNMPAHGARGPLRSDSCAFSARRNDHICHPSEVPALCSPRIPEHLPLPARRLRVACGIGAGAGNRTRTSRVALPRSGLRAASAWWAVDGIEPLAQSDCVYGAATAPACPYWHCP
jgi:hypothetical protein